MAVSGLSFKNTLVGTGWTISCILCKNGLRKQSSQLVGSPFLAVKVFFPSLDKLFPAKSRDYCKLVKGWVWFESRTCREWLQGHLCKV